MTYTMPNYQFPDRETERAYNNKLVIEKHFIHMLIP